LNLSLLEEKKGERRKRIDKMEKVRYKEVVRRSRKILPKFTIPSVEKVSQPTISTQTYREE
jgi:hypothetical protein